jgi:hypothetical protein
MDFLPHKAGGALQSGIQLSRQCEVAYFGVPLSLALDTLNASNKQGEKHAEIPQSIFS